LGALRSGSLPWRVLLYGLAGKEGWDWDVDAIGVWFFGCRRWRDLEVFDDVVLVYLLCRDVE
jgi:hypothetical protein